MESECRRRTDTESERRGPGACGDGRGKPARATPQSVVSSLHSLAVRHADLGSAPGTRLAQQLATHRCLPPAPLAPPRPPPQVTYDGEETVTENAWISKATDPAGKGVTIKYPNGNVFQGHYDDEKLKQGKGKYTWSKPEGGTLAGAPSIASADS